MLIWFEHLERIARSKKLEENSQKKTITDMKALKKVVKRKKYFKIVACESLPISPGKGLL